MAYLGDYAYYYYYYYYYLIKFNVRMQPIGYGRLHGHTRQFLTYRNQRIFLAPNRLCAQGIRGHWPGLATARGWLALAVAPSRGHTVGRC